MSERLHIGFIPLADATALLIAVDKGFCAAEGLDVELVREVSWSNVRDKLNIGLFDADDEGHAIVRVSQVPDEAADRAVLAVKNCPERAVSIEQ